ncbi:hypothetical protein CYMTET_23068 [Cymbomonas tetramitiformis]|uniref:Heat shock protein 70 n=1 Tax=Cymbomonas tetramitiformis TaxID=36881 RepID=A0AAE0L1N6_9CHLO|nr:hypothetical protein CYMTET_23068 [Cymbomonas tetramitiformis]|eukprot:gene9115-10802_t
MSVAGFDFGNDTSEIGLARRKGIDVVLNSESKRETPSMVSFSNKQRFLGVQGANCLSMNPKNTIFNLKTLIGRKFSEPGVQAELATCPFKVTESPEGWPEVNVLYMDEPRKFTVEKIVAMLLSDLKTIAENDQGSKISDCVISVPVYFTDTQRRALLDAATVSGLNCLRLMHETTATALAYGIYKTDLPEKDAINVGFVDVGQSSLQCCIVAFKKGQLKVLSHGYDRTLGGRDFDKVLVDKFAAEFKAKSGGCDVFSNSRALLRLRVACEKLKKVLSANAEAPINIECLMDERDFSSKCTREEFEALSVEPLSRVEKPLLECLAASGLTAADIENVELVGSASRVPAIVACVQKVFEKEPRRTLNASECVAKGCALQGAMLSPTFKVREFEVQDAHPFPVSFSWKKADDEGKITDEITTQTLFPKNHVLPSTKVMNLCRSAPFDMVCSVEDPETNLLPGMSPELGTFQVGPIPATKTGETPKVKVTFKLNLHGCAYIESAQAIEEEIVEVPIQKTEKKEGEAKEGDAAPMETEGDEPKTEKKKKTKKIDVPIKSVTPGAMSPTDLQAAVEKEYEMALQDRVMEETKDRKNAVEEYVYNMRNKLYAELESYVTEPAREALCAKLQETEDWLYEDGEDETKGVYVAKLEELNKLGAPIEERYKESELRGPAASGLTAVADSYMAQCSDPKYEHIDAADKDKVYKECETAKTWLADKLAQQAALAKTAELAVLTRDITAKKETIERFCKPIMSKPKPAPKPDPKPETKPEETTEAPKAEGEPMETEAAEPEPAPMQADID